MSSDSECGDSREENSDFEVDFDAEVDLLEEGKQKVVTTGSPMTTPWQINIERINNYQVKQEEAPSLPANESFNESR